MSFLRVKIMSYKIIYAMSKNFRNPCKCGEGATNC